MDVKVGARRRELTSWSHSLRGALLGTVLALGLALVPLKGASSADAARTGCPLAFTSVTTQQLTASTTFAGVDGSSPDDLWAVGTTTDPGPDHSLFEHWGGSAWQRVGGPAGL